MRESYEVHFGNENEIAKCSCLDWLKSGYLLNSGIYPSWSSNTLSPLYRNIPFRSLDEDFIQLIEQLSGIDENKSEGELEVGEILCKDDETIFEPLLERKSLKALNLHFFAKY